MALLIFSRGMASGQRENIARRIATVGIESITAAISSRSRFQDLLHGVLENAILGAVDLVL